MDAEHASVMATRLHLGELEKDGTPLLAHLRRVAAIVPVEARTVAWLHEALESTAQRPVVVGFDGSDESQAAVREAAALVRARTLVVVTVWEPALALAITQAPDDLSGFSSELRHRLEIARLDELADVTPRLAPS